MTVTNDDEGTLSELSRDSYSELCRITLMLIDDLELSKCVAMRVIVDVTWYEQHIAHQPNMLLTCDMELPEDILGMVMVRDVIVGGRRCNLFLICVRPGIQGVVKQFTIAHELGHVLMHGSLLHAGMVLPERMWSCSREQDERRRLMELEANIYAMLSIVPTSAIQQLQGVFGGELMPEVLHEAMTWLRGEPFPLRLARERLILHEIVKGGSRNTYEDFRRHIWNPRASWTINGAAGMRDDVAKISECPLLTQEQLEQWRSSLQFPVASARACLLVDEDVTA